MLGRRGVEAEAMRRLDADRELAGRFDELLETARVRERELREAEAAGRPVAELRLLGLALDEALTAAMRAAYAAQRVEIGPRGYDDRVFRRKARAKSDVARWTREAERLLTLREVHRLAGIRRVPAPVR